MSRRNHSSQRRYSDDEFHNQDRDYLRRSRKRKSSSSSSPDYPSRRPTEERRTRCRSPYSSRSVKRRRYDTPRYRYPSSRSRERRGSHDSLDRRGRHASTLSLDTRRRRARYHLETTRYAPSCHRYPQPKRRDHVPSNHHPSERSMTCDAVSMGETIYGFFSMGEARDEEISRYMSSNFCFPTNRARSCLAAKQDDLASLVSFPGFVADDIVLEILARLPVKSLMRFKSVCKHWLSMIKHDRHLIDLHQNNSLNSRPDLLCITGTNPRKYQQHDQESGDDEQQREYDISKCKLFPQQILCADIVEAGSATGEEIVPQTIMTDHDWFDYENVLGVVNGVACFLDWHGDDIKLYNVSTREASPWIKTTLLSENLETFGSHRTSIHRETIYRFGFDPEKKELKVFCFCRPTASTQPSRIAECRDYTNCEVLTVGRDTKWRRISVVPDENNQIMINKVFSPFEEKRDPVYANGTIYWRYEVWSSKKDLDADDPDVIVALDVGSEKFRVIPIPDEPHVHHRHTALFMLRGRVAVRYWLSYDTVKLWMLDDGPDKKLENCQGSERNWISETITLPYAYSPRHVEFHGVADQLVLFVYSEDRSFYRKFGYLHFYDRRKKTFNKVGIEGLSSVPFIEGTSIITTSTGSLYPVQPQQDKIQHFAVS